MSDIQSYTDDEFIAEAQRRVNQGNWSPDRYMSTLQSNDRAKLDQIRGAIIRAKVESIHSGENHPVLVDLAVLCDNLDAITGHEPIPAMRINTTRYGRDLGE